MIAYCALPWCIWVDQGSIYTNKVQAGTLIQQSPGLCVKDRAIGLPKLDVHLMNLEAFRDIRNW